MPRTILKATMAVVIAADGSPEPSNLDVILNSAGALSAGRSAHTARTIVMTVIMMARPGITLRD